MSTLNVTSIKGRAGATPNFPDGAIVSGIATIGAGGIDVTGVVTATKISAGSSITATSFYGSGANLSDLPSQSPVVTGIASGTIPANRALCVHSDGKVGVVTGTNITWGSFAELGSSPPNINGTDVIEIAYGDGKVFVIARFHDPNGVASPGKCIVGTPSADNLSVSWGSWTQFEANLPSGNVYCRVVYDSNANKFVLAYNRSTLKTRVATVSGTSTITYGAEVELIGSDSEGIEGVFDPDSNQVIWAYHTGANIFYSRIGAVSGTSISYGTQVAISANNSNGKTAVTYDTKNNKVILATGYNGDQSNKGWAFIGTVSGTGYVGNAVQSAGEIQYYYQYSRLNLLYDEDRDRYVFAGYNTNNNQWESLVGKYVSATSITWGDPNLIESFSSGTSNLKASLVYDPYSKVYNFIYNNAASDAVMYAQATINRADSAEPEQMTWNTRQIFSGTYGNLTMAKLGNSLIMSYGQNYVAYYRLEGFRNSTLKYDGNNYIGYSAGAYTNGQTVTVQVVGNVSTQVGLSPGFKYYIQGDGGLVSFVDPNIPSASYKEAGIALDATKLLIK